MEKEIILTDKELTRRLQEAYENGMKHGEALNQERICRALDNHFVRKTLGLSSVKGLKNLVRGVTTHG